MSRTFRRRGQRHDHSWVLRDCRWIDGALISFRIDPNSRQGRRAIARFHLDAYRTMRGAAPRWYRRIFDHRRRTWNTRELTRGLTIQATIRYATFDIGTARIGPGGESAATDVEEKLKWEWSLYLLPARRL